MTDQAIIAAALHGYVSDDALAALDRLVAERDALRARVDEAVADEPRDADLLAAALARAEAAEKEAAKVQEGRDIDRRILQGFRDAAESRCATLEAALRDILSLHPSGPGRCLCMSGAIICTPCRVRAALGGAK